MLTVFITLICLKIQTPAIAATGQQPEKMLTLEKAKAIGLEKNPTIAAAMARVRQARESIVQARAGFLPSVTARAGWDYTEKTTKNSPAYDETQHSSRVSVSQTLFDGFYTRYQTLAAENKVKKNQSAREDEKRLLCWSIAQAFLNTQLAEESIKIARSDMAFNQKLEEEALLKEKVGAGSYSDVLNFRTRVNTAVSALLTAQQDLIEARTGLAALMGYPDAKLPDKVSLAPLPETVVRTASINGGVPYETILQDRPDLKEAFYSLQEADAEIRATISAFYPTVSLSASYGTGAGDHFLDDDVMGASAGINVSIDLFSGGSKRSKVAEARARKRELEHALENTRINAMADIQKTLANITILKQQLALQEENTHLIETTRDLVEKEYRAGQASLVRLNEAQNDLVSALGTLSQSKASLILALEELDYYIGKNFNPDP